MTIPTTIIETRVETATLVREITRTETITTTHKITETSTITERVSAEVLDVCFSRVDFCRDDIISWINNAESYVYVMVYSFTADEIADALVDAHRRGLDVRVVIDNEQAAGPGSVYDRLKAAGVPTRVDARAALMHHKVVVIDGEIVITGSYNFSAAAEDRNDENLIIIRDPEVARLYKDEFLRLWNLSV